MTRVIFMGTPQFAVPSLAVLVDGGYELVAVVTQPDRPSGRGRQVEFSPVKQLALERGIPVLQPPSLRQAEAQAELAALQPDVIVVTAYGQILRPAVLELPDHGCINVHASLLPRWRGAAPVQAAILAGDQITGSTIMCMDEGMDTGAILAQAALVIEPGDTGGSLTERLAQQGAQLLAKTLPAWLAGEIEPVPQDENLATVCRPLRKSQGRIDWSLPSTEIARAVRAYNPWPTATTAWQGMPLRILEAGPVEAGPRLEPVEPGRVVGDGQGSVVVSAGVGWLQLHAVQLAGRRAMAMDEFLRGQRDFVGSRLG